jgi:hypothetical protein
VIAEMTQQPQSGSPVLTLKQFPPEPAPKRRTPAEKARILAHLALQLAALEIDERRGNGNA